ncbi:MAG: Wadjet anti-phage system protein JetD domain-containing protein [Steroidobacteraceae bacterium]
MNELAPPAWLAEEDEIRALLHEVLDRLDKRPGTQRQNHVVIPAERFVPSLQRGDASADQTWALIGELSARNVCTVRAASRSPYDPVWSGSRLAFHPTVEPLLRDWLGRPSIEPAMQSWRRAVLAQAQVFPAGVEALLVRRIAIPGRSDAEVVAALSRAAATAGPITLRRLSAQIFWGDSKVLDERGDLITALLPQLQLRDRPIVAAVHLPLTMRGVLFIENQDSYALATEGAPRDCEQLALVYAAGFRSAALRIRSRGGALLHFAGPGLESCRSDFEQWWHDESSRACEIWFWGDLDFAGMQILKSLRARFGDVQAWRPGYEPMLAALQASNAHEANDRGQVDPGVTGCSYADEVLLPAIRRYGCVDQEWIGIA